MVGYARVFDGDQLLPYDFGRTRRLGVGQLTGDDVTRERQAKRLAR